MLTISSTVARRAALAVALGAESWLSKFGQADEWSFCLRAARMAREQERR
jgi:hypothetical protein